MHAHGPKIQIITKKKKGDNLILTVRIIKGKKIKARKTK
jgi:hypothetical protein